MEEHDDKLVIAKNDFQGLIKIFTLASGYNKALFSALGVLVASSILAMIAANLLGRFAEAVGKLSKGEFGIQDTLYLALPLLALEGIIILMRWYGGLSLAKATNGLVLGIRLSMFKKLSLLPISHFDKQPLGRIITRLTGDVEGIEQLFATSLSRIIDALIKIIAVTRVKFYFFQIIINIYICTIKIFFPCSIGQICS